MRRTVPPPGSPSKRAEARGAAHRPFRAAGFALAGALLLLSALPGPARGQYALAAPSGDSLAFERASLLEMRDRSVTLYEDLQRDPDVLYYTSYGQALTPADAESAYPWNAIEVVTDSSAAVITPGNLREADRAYYNYAVLRMRAVRDDPDVSCDTLVEREMEALDGFIDGWIVARTLFGGPAYAPLDEFAFARAAGVLEGMIADRGDRQLGGCLHVWREANADAVAAYRAWHRDYTNADF